MSTISQRELKSENSRTNSELLPLHRRKTRETGRDPTKHCQWQIENSTKQKTETNLEEVN